MSDYYEIKKRGVTSFNPDLHHISYYFGSFHLYDQKLDILSFKMVYHNICHLLGQ